ncbi:hypothetical protein CR513_01901, partial [Mucuna pruriens]
MKKDSVACYDIESKIFNSRQGTFSVVEYYGTLNGLWIKRNFTICLRYFSIVQSEETRRPVMVDKGSSNIESTMMIGKGSTKGSTSIQKPFTKSSRGEYCKYYK